MQTLEQRLRSNQLISSIDVTAFISIMVVLLFIMMGPSSVIIDGVKPDVDLPSVYHPIAMRGARREDAIIVGITRDGRVYFGNQEVELWQLPAKIQDAVKNGSPQIVYFKADGRARYRHVSNVLDAVRMSGLEKIAFLTEQRKTSSH